MKWLNWLLGESQEPTVTTIERIWLTERAMLNGLVQQIRHLQANGRGVLLLGHFSDDLGLAVEKLQQEQLAFRVWQPSSAIENALRALRIEPDEVWMVKANTLPAIPEDDITYASPPVDEKLSVLILHHHPEIHEDERVLSFAVRLPVTEVTWLSSLEHPLFRRFAGENLQQMLRVLGLKEDEPVESSLIPRQITHAQRRVARQVGIPRSAESAEEWFELNMPPK